MSPAHMEPIGVKEEQARARSTMTLCKIFEGACICTYRVLAAQFKLLLPDRKKQHEQQVSRRL